MEKTHYRLLTQISKPSLAFLKEGFNQRNNFVGCLYLVKIQTEASIFVEIS